MHDELHPAVDEYLETIGWLAEEGGPVISARVARRLGKSKASVSEMLERLVAGGYVERPDRRILLTEAGNERARGVIRRHRLADAAPGQNVRLARIAQEVEIDVASVGYLDEGGFVPGVEARVLERGPDGTFVLSVGGDVLPLGPRLCERLFVVIAD